LKIKSLIILGTTLLVAIIIIITSQGMLFVRGNISTVTDEHTEQIEEEIGSGVQNTAVEIISTLDGIMEDQVTMIESWVETPTIINTAASGMSYTMEDLYESWSASSTRQYDGDEAMGDGDPDNDINPDTSEYLIRLSKDSDGAYPEIFITDARGYAVAASGATGDFDQGPDDWRAFKSATGGPDEYVKHKPSAAGEDWWGAANSASDGVFVSDIEYDDSAYIWATDICVVIRDPDTGDNLGVMKAVYNFAKALSFVTDTSSLDADEIKIITNNGMIAATSEADQTKIMNDAYNVRTLNAYQDAEVGNIGYSVEVDEDGEEMLIGYAGCDDNDRICLVSREASQSLAPIREIENKNSQLISDVSSNIFFVLMSVIVVAAIILVAVISLLNSRLTKPLIKMANAAGKIKNGDLNVSVDEAGNNEVSDLGKAFNQMILSVRLIAGDMGMKSSPNSENAPIQNKGVA
jgi:HAMP domain-containing protein